jgi:hypothetical protein
MEHRERFWGTEKGKSECNKREVDEDEKESSAKERLTITII